jgi:hypothetical protein
MKFIELQNAERKKLFKEIKLKMNCSWESFYPQYGIGRSMFFNYLSGRYALPKLLFLKWIEKIKPLQIKYSEVEKSKYVKKNINKIKMDEDLAEIFGVLNGDGHLSNTNYEICVVGNLNEEEYYFHLKKLFERKFGTPFTLRREKSAFKLRCYSKEISNLLHKEYGFIKGSKINRLKIPKKALISNKISRAYIRGLFDTDGGFLIRREKDPMIHITSATPGYLNEVKRLLEKLGFIIAKGTQKIFIYRKEDVNKFFKEIKPANSKHLKKFEIYSNL